MRELRAGQLLLEPLCVAHAEAMFKVLREPKLYRYLDYPPPPSVEHLRTVYQRLEKRKSPDGADHWLNWVVRENSGPPIGFVQATVLPDGTAWIAYVIAVARQGHRLGTLATALMVDHLASEYDVKRYLATVEADNTPSIRLLERLGFGLAPAQIASEHDLSASERLFVR